MERNVKFRFDENDVSYNAKGWLDFMKKFGYIEEDDGDSEALYTENGISEIIKSVQKFGAIEETGQIDNATLKLMTSRRCGVPDVIRRKASKKICIRIGRMGKEKYNILVSKHKYDTYNLPILSSIANWSPKLSEHTVVKNIQKALDTWGGYGRLNFHRTPSPDADIIVAFGRGYHGDSFPFDGSGNILAHAFFPYEGSDLGGDIHFDDDENWMDKNENASEDGTDFYAVALHELGHSLVNRMLKEDYNTPSTNFEDHYETTPYTTESSPTIHSTEVWTSSTTTEYSTLSSELDPTTTSIPTSTEFLNTLTTVKTDHVVTYEGDDEYVDDHKKHDKKHNIPKTNSPSLPNICDGYVDAIAALRHELFVFKEGFVWRYKEKGELLPGYPIALTQMFPDLPKSIRKIDAAYERPDGMIIMFTGKVFWVYDGTNFRENSPKPITSYGLPDYLDDIDAVQTWERNKKTYFYKKDRFWRYNETSKTMDSGYPLHMERWRGVPENLNAATTWKDGATYFFKGELFWKFDNDWVIITEQSPLPTAQIWFGCPEEEQRMRRLFS
ncbi:hypothetical protein NQ314_011647 [Rhamnusium bicolor]|uniref:Peptidase metallopeptidase domain-containing protein n=1 Tax=Rhamnusium bicolor TaxID=1586634 RepID=A0AAV8XG59_9CUCU|nr:hypothetical protein NQ314_011647 [Rhamnusium bicolor]